MTKRVSMSLNNEDLFNATIVNIAQDSTLLAKDDQYNGGAHQSLLGQVPTKISLDTRREKRSMEEKGEKHSVDDIILNGREDSTFLEPFVPDLCLKEAPLKSKSENIMTDERDTEDAECGVQGIRLNREEDAKPFETVVPTSYPTKMTLDTRKRKTRMMDERDQDRGSDDIKLNRYQDALFIEPFVPALSLKEAPLKSKSENRMTDERDTEECGVQDIRVNSPQDARLFEPVVPTCYIEDGSPRSRKAKKARNDGDQGHDFLHIKLNSQQDASFFVRPVRDPSHRSLCVSSFTLERYIDHHYEDPGSCEREDDHGRESIDDYGSESIDDLERESIDDLERESIDDYGSESIDDLESESIDDLERESIDDHGYSSRNDSK